MALTHLSLFSGIGGIDLAAEWAGFETIAFVECNDYAQQVLRKHWPDVPILEDVKNVTRETIMAYTKHTGRAETQEQRENIRLQQEIQARAELCNVQSQRSDRVGGYERGNAGIIPKEQNAPITLITGGVPCQPASVAGKRRGTEDDRWLWPEAIRILSEIKPTWAVFENPTGILTLEDGVVFNDLLSGMEAKGYEVQPVIVPACAVNAPHRRDRCFIVAHTNNHQTSRQREYSRQILSDTESEGFNMGSQDVADTTKQGFQNRRGASLGEYGGTEQESKRCNSLHRDWWAVEPELGRVASGLPNLMDGSWWDREPDIPRVATGIKNRVDRLRCLGNAVVPQQVYPILKAIADIERGNDANT